MDDDAMHRIVEGILALVLTSLATWLAGYLTRRLLGPRRDELEA